MDTEGRPYGRKDVLDGLLQAGVQRDSIEAFGSAGAQRWLGGHSLNRLVQLQELEVKGKTALVNGIKKAAIYVLSTLLCVYQCHHAAAS